LRREGDGIPSLDEGAQEPKRHMFIPSCNDQCALSSGHGPSPFDWTDFPAPATMPDRGPFDYVGNAREGIGCNSIN
jgi:hypothetical protein